MPPGPARQAAARVLRAAGMRCRGAREPYEGTAKFVETPSALVLLSLERFRARDIGFIETVRRRAPETRILLLVPEGARSMATRALTAGADAYLPLPFYAAELDAIARRLVRPAAPAPRAGAPALARLATEVSHAVNNPLQVLSLMCETEDEPSRRAGLASEVSRVRDVVDILGRYGHRGALAKDRGLLGPLLVACLDARAQEEQLAVTGKPPKDGPAFSFDAEQVSLALDDLVGLLVARAPAKPVPIAVRVRSRGKGPESLVEAAVRGTGVHVPPEELDALLESVVWSHDETRLPYPGLALTDAVARDHGGRVTGRETDQGTVLAMQLPVSD